MKFGQHIRPTMNNKNEPQLQFKILTPAAEFFSGPVYEVILPTASGEIGILPGHIPYLTYLKSGEIMYREQKNSSLQRLCRIKDGFVELNHCELTILTNEVM